MRAYARLLEPLAPLKAYAGGAKQLSITQPAVSQHIKALEQELGVRIFERINGQLVVTKQGEEVVNARRKCLGCTITCGRICATAAA